MPGISRLILDSAGGTIQTNPVSTGVFVNGKEVAIFEASVQSHSPCPDPVIHCNATMLERSSTVFAKGIGVVREGDAATCGHTATGSSDTFAI